MGFALQQQTFQQIAQHKEQIGARKGGLGLPVKGLPDAEYRAETLDIELSILSSIYMVLIQETVYFYHNN